MNLNFDKKQFTKKVGTYLIGPANALEDSTLQTRAQNYKRQLSNKMYPIEKLRITEKIPNLEGYNISRKIDGEFSLLFFDGKKTISCNPGGTVRTGLPCFDELSKLLIESKVKSGIFACDMFVLKKERERVHELIRIIRNPKTEKDLLTLGVYIHDIISINETAFEPSTKKISETIEDYFSSGVLVKPLESVTVSSNRNIIKIYEDWVENEGSEGLVVRHDSVGWFKIKPVHTIDCVVVGFSDSVNERKGLLHDLLVGLLRSDGNIQLLGKVGGGFTDQERKEIFEDLQKKVVPSDYVEVSSAYLAYEWVKPLVAEIKCLDVISKNSRGDNINKMVLNWNESESKYEGIRKKPFVSILAPRFVRMREDKSVTLEEVSVKQVATFVEVEDIEKALADIELPKSELLRRDVYFKKQGEKLMIRKILMWKTNKESSQEYPPFITFHTDFSSQRQEPLTTNLKPSTSLKKAEIAFEELLEKSVKKGWELYDGSNS